MQPTPEQIGDATLYCGDCLDVMRDIPDGSVDALITDPPFGIGFVYKQGREMAATPDAYWEWFAPLYREALRCVKPGGFVAVWQAQLNMRHFWDWFGDDIHIYCAAKNFVQLRKTPINYGYDPVVMFYKGGAPPLRPLKPQRNLDYFVGDTRPHPASCRSIERGHPCPRPLNATREVIRNFTLPAAIVLDPFAGSGTTGVACQQEGRRCILIEKDPDYYQTMRERLSAPRQTTLAEVS